jgi:hypothetical protein
MPQLMPRTEKLSLNLSTDKHTASIFIRLCGYTAPENGRISVHAVSQSVLHDHMPISYDLKFFNIP